MLIVLITVNSMAIKIYHSEHDLSNSDGKRNTPKSCFSSLNLSDLIL
jgi:hypothetical protein